MSDGITVTRVGECVTIALTVGERVAWVKVTREYAKQLAAYLLVVATDGEPEVDGDGQYVDA